MKITLWASQETPRVEKSFESCQNWPKRTPQEPKIIPMLPTLAQLGPKRLPRLPKRPPAAPKGLPKWPPGTPKNAPWEALGLPGEPKSYLFFSYPHFGSHLEPKKLLKSSFLEPKIDEKIAMFFIMFFCNVFIKCQCFFKSPTLTKHRPQRRFINFSSFEKPCQQQPKN